VKISCTQLQTNKWLFIFSGAFQHFFSQHYVPGFHPVLFLKKRRSIRYKALLLLKTTLWFWKLFQFTSLMQGMKVWLLKVHSMVSTN